MTRLKSLLLAALLIAVFIPASGQNSTADFSGTWGFNETKSNLGDSGYRMAATTLVATQQANDFTIDRTQPSPEGEEIKTSEKYTLDGKECTNAGMMNSVRKSKVSWSEDKKSLSFATTITFEMNGEKMEILSSEVWKSADDNKTLTIESNMTSPWGEMKTTLVYDKK